MKYREENKKAFPGTGLPKALSSVVAVFVLLLASATYVDARVVDTLADSTAGETLPTATVINCGDGDDGGNDLGDLFNVIPSFLNCLLGCAIKTPVTSAYEWAVNDADFCDVFVAGWQCATGCFKETLYDTFKPYLHKDGLKKLLEDIILFKVTEALGPWAQVILPFVKSLDKAK